MKVTYIISDINKALAFEWISEYLDKEKFLLSFVLILKEPAELETFLKERNIYFKVFYYSSKRDLLSIFWKVNTLLRQLKPDIVHCHLLYGSLIGLTAAKAAGVRNRVYTRHHSDYHQRYFPKGVKWDKWCNRMATKIVAPSEAVRTVLVDLENVPKRKIVVVHHGFDLDYFNHVPESSISSLRNIYNSKGHYPIIGVISRFTELKGIQYIIPAFQKLLKSYPEGLLMLFNAKGDYEVQIKEQLKCIPERSYRLIPFENDLAAVYRLFDVFVQVSTDKTIEAFGQTYVEALAAGIPSIFTLAGIASDFIVDRENALVVPFKDADAIYHSLLELLENESLKQKIIARGKECVIEQFELSTMIQNLENLYESG